MSADRPALACCECDREIESLIGHSKHTDVGLICLSCTFYPGWFRDPEQREQIDRAHPGVSLSEQQESTVA